MAVLQRVQVGAILDLENLLHTATFGDDLWDRFTGLPAQQEWYYSSLLEIFRERHDSPLVEEFAAVVAELMERARQAPERAVH